ncbi:MAG: hypothetical protein PUD91_04740 [Bacteroidales bacterium]|nr:hypothetical protein [Bacteroidales bacterium]
MKNHNLLAGFGLLLIVSLAVQPVQAQRRLLDEVKQDLNALTLNVDNYQNALNKLKPTLSHEETKNEAEVWFMAGKIAYAKYDKYRALQTIGKKPDEKAMGAIILEGYDYMMTALKLDTVPEKDKHGKVKINKNTGLPKVKTKYSKDIHKIVLSHYNDYKLVGRIFYSSVPDFDKAYKAWDIYTSLPDSPNYSNSLRNQVTDSVIGEYRFYQGVVAKMDERYSDALGSFFKAIDKGYNKKDVFDYAIGCAEHEKNDSVLVDVVRQAYKLYGKNDSQYIRILFNYAINNKKYDIAIKIIDQAIADYPDNAEYYDLKGVLLENQSGSIDSSFEYFKKAVDLDGDFIKANFDLGRYYYNMALRESDTSKLKEKLALALPYLEKVHTAEPSNRAAKDALRIIYYNFNDAEKMEALGE